MAAAAGVAILAGEELVVEQRLPGDVVVAAPLGGIRQVIERERIDGLLPRRVLQHPFGRLLVRGKQERAAEEQCTPRWLVLADRLFERFDRLAQGDTIRARLRRLEPDPAERDENAAVVRISLGGVRERHDGAIRLAGLASRRGQARRRAPGPDRAPQRLELIDPFVGSAERPYRSASSSRARVSAGRECDGALQGVTASAGCCASRWHRPSR